MPWTESPRAFIYSGRVNHELKPRLVLPVMSVLLVSGTFLASTSRARAGRNHKQTTYQVPIRSTPVVTWLSPYTRTSAFLVGLAHFICEFLEVLTKEQGLVLGNWKGMCPQCLCKLPQLNRQADESESLTEWKPSTRAWSRIFRVYKNRRIYCLSTHRSQYNPAFFSQLCLGVTETYGLDVFMVYTDCSGYLRAPLCKLVYDGVFQSFATYK